MRSAAPACSPSRSGGKEVRKDALLALDIEHVVFALAVLGLRDVRFLWRRIVELARRLGEFPGSDTACGFANTTMRSPACRGVSRIRSVARSAASASSRSAFMTEASSAPMRGVLVVSRRVSN